jgi:hypothetical protein
MQRRWRCQPRWNSHRKHYLSSWRTKRIWLSSWPLQERWWRVWRWRGIEKLVWSVLDTDRVATTITNRGFHTRTHPVQRLVATGLRKRVTSTIWHYPSSRSQNSVVRTLEYGWVSVVIISGFSTSRRVCELQQHHYTWRTMLWSGGRYTGLSMGWLLGLHLLL